MKKYIIITLLCFFSTVSYGQTKEETISWLKEKFENYLTGGYHGKGGLWYKTDILSFQLNECELFIKYKETTSYARGQTSLREMTIPLKNIGIATLDEIGTTAYFIFQISVIKYKVTQSTDEYMKIGEIKYTSNSVQKVEINLTREEGLYERIQTALTHLATFCPEKKKEMF
jgi:hypothetical protein